MNLGLGVGNSAHNNITGWQSKNKRECIYCEGYLQKTYANVFNDKTFKSLCFKVRKKTRVPVITASVLRFIKGPG